MTETTKTNADVAAEIAGADADNAVSAAAQAEAAMTPAQKAAATRAAKQAAEAAAPSKPKRVKIILEENDAIPPGGQFFGVNGTGYQIQPGKEVEVPEFLLGVLDTAITTKPILNDDGQVVGSREVPRFPYRIIR